MSLPQKIDAGNGNEAWLYATIHDPLTIEQARMMARHPLVNDPVRLMPDCHAGVGGAGTVGSAILMSGGLIPAAIGPDIGCGMTAVHLSIQAEQLDPEYRRGIFQRIMSAIPMGTGGNHQTDMTAKAGPVISQIEEKHGPLSSEKLRHNAHAQFGTLGSGNHFIEVSESQDGAVWAVVHSGSRGVGFQLAAHSMRAAKELNADTVEHTDLSYLPEGSPEFERYVHDTLWAQAWAKENRNAMMDAVLNAFDDDGPAFEVLEHFDCHHNYGEQIDGGWLIRKGAISARFGDKGVIPGSMGTDSYIVHGLGNPESLWTAPHGSGRMLARGEARRSLNVEDFKAQMAEAGRVWDMHNAEKLIDESPAAYKPIETVIADAESMVRVDHKLSAIINCKG